MLEEAIKPHLILDTRGFHCPIPLLRAQKALRDLAQGDVLLVVSTDSTAVDDFASFANNTGHQLLKTQQDNGEYFFWLVKGGSASADV